MKFKNKKAVGLIKEHLSLYEKIISGNPVGFYSGCGVCRAVAIEFGSPGCHRCPLLIGEIACTYHETYIQQRDRTPKNKKKMRIRLKYLKKKLLPTIEEEK